MQPDSSALPLSLHRTTAFLTFGLAIFMVVAHAVFAATTAARTSLSAKARFIAPFLIGSFLAAWLTLALIVADGTNFPLTVELRRPASGLIALVPFLIALFALFSSRTVGVINKEMPKAWLVAVQTYRVAGIIFIFPFLTYGILPPGFAVPAGIGDALTGIFAPVVALLIAHNRPHAIKWAVAWNLFGTLDLIVAPTTAIFYQARVLNIYPVALVPLFLGPPIGILTHIYSLRNLAARR